MQGDDYMLSTNSNEIRITKGDTMSVEVELKNLDGSLYEMKEGDKIVFSVKQRLSDKYEVLLEKAGLPFEFSAEDTNLPTGKYYYDVVLTSRAGDRVTVIEPSLFEVTPKVHD